MKKILLSFIIGSVCVSSAFCCGNGDDDQSFVDKIKQCAQTVVDTVKPSNGPGAPLVEVAEKAYAPTSTWFPDSDGN